MWCHFTVFAECSHQALTKGITFSVWPRATIFLTASFSQCCCSMPSGSITYWESSANSYSRARFVKLVSHWTIKSPTAGDVPKWHMNQIIHVIFLSFLRPLPPLPLLLGRLGFSLSILRIAPVGNLKRCHLTHSGYVRKHIYAMTKCELLDWEFQWLPLFAKAEHRRWNLLQNGLLSVVATRCCMI